MQQSQWKIEKHHEMLNTMLWSSGCLFFEELIYSLRTLWSTIQLCQFLKPNNHYSVLFKYLIDPFAAKWATVSSRDQSE